MRMPDFFPLLPPPRGLLMSRMTRMHVNVKSVALRLYKVHVARVGTRTDF